MFTYSFHGNTSHRILVDIDFIVIFENFIHKMQHFHSRFPSSAPSYPLLLPLNFKTSSLIVIAAVR